ncbi:MAG: hypothetical protein WB558_10245 [Terriglobales bacterium]
MSAIAVTWVPLLVLSILQGVAYGKQLQIPFLRDFAVNVRFLVALPILILAESSIDHEWRLLVVHFLKSGLVKEPELPSFEAAIRRVIRLRDSVLPETIIAAVAYALFLFGTHTELLMGNTSNWHALGFGSNSGLTLAGWWFNLISTPFFRFLLLRWIWRVFLWALFLWCVSRINLSLVATHSDLAAGLGFLSLGQKRFSPIVFAGGAVVKRVPINKSTLTSLTVAAALPMVPLVVLGTPADRLIRVVLKMLI